jgi:hypothetical protein
MTAPLYPSPEEEGQGPNPLPRSSQFTTQQIYPFIYCTKTLLIYRIYSIKGAGVPIILSPIIPLSRVGQARPTLSSFLPDPPSLEVNPDLDPTPTQEEGLEDARDRVTEDVQRYLLGMSDSC